MLEQYTSRFISEHRLIEPEAGVVVGVSGGLDSVVLLHMLQKLRYDVRAAHVNYRLRGAASDDDEAFVRACCRRLGVPIMAEACNAEDYAAEHGCSIQEAARDLRYAFFARVAAGAGARYVAVAHHQDDQAETVLLHLFRGAGLEGVAGMPLQRPLEPSSRIMLVRPFLGVRRAVLAAYAEAEGLTWREDESNRSMKYQRNVLRSAVLPLLESYFGASVRENIARSASLVRAYVDDTFHQTLEDHFALAAQGDTDGGRLDLDALRLLAPVWRRRILLEALKRWLPAAPRHAALARQVDALFEAQVGRRVVVGGGTVWRERGYLRFVLEDGINAGMYDHALVHPGETLNLNTGTLAVEAVPERPARLDAGAPGCVLVDADRLTFPLTVRRWQPGDRFRPLGMAGTKKVSDFLTDEKIPAHQRATIRVLLSGDEIVWVVGLRPAHGVRVRAGTERFVKITYIPRV